MKTKQTIPAFVILAFAILLSAPSRAQTAPALPSPGEETVKLEAFTVTGTNIKRLDQENTLPVSVFNMAQLQARDSATSNDLLISIPEITNLPQNESALAGGNNRGGTTYAALRGLAASNTLVLLNGRRLPTSPFGFGNSLTAVNINTLPTTGLQQLEVLRDGASAIYGSDAVAGVINYVTDKSKRGGSITQRFGQPQHGNGLDYKLNLTYGNEFAEGKGNYLIEYTGYARASIHYYQRELSRSSDRIGIARAPWNVPGSSYDGLTNASQWVQFIPGASTATTATRFYYPTSGVATDVPSINTTAIPRSLWLNSNQYQTGQPRTDRNAISGHVQYQLTPSITAFVEGNYYLGRSDLNSTPSPLAASSSRVFIGADNPYNPLGSRFYSPTGAPNSDGTARLTGSPQQLTIISMLFWDNGNQQIKTIDSEYRFVAGLRGKIGTTSWNWEVGLLAGGIYASDESKNGMMDSWTRAAALRTDATAWNPFTYTFKVQNGAVVADKPYVNPKSVWDTMRRSYNRFGQSKIASFDFRIGGVVADLWAGPIQVSTGVQWFYDFKYDHKDPFSGVNPPGSIGGDGTPLDPQDNDMIQFSPKFPWSGSRSIASGYVEAQIPLVAAKNNVAFARSASLNGAVRGEHYSDFGYTTKPKFGGDWRPLSWLMFRGSINKGFHAPELIDLLQTPAFTTASPPGTRDTTRNNFFTLAGLAPDNFVLRKTYSTPSPFLQPETSSGKSVGMVVDVPAIKGLSFTVDYWEVTQNNLIVEVGSTSGLDEANLRAYTQAQLAAGKSITSIDVGYQALPGQNHAYQGDPNILRNQVNATDIALFQPAYAKVPQSQWIAPLGTWVGWMAQQQNSSGRNFTNGLDFSVRYNLPRMEIGQFHISTEWSEFLQKYNKLQPNFGKNDAIAQMILPKWKSSTTIQWSKGNWDWSLNAAYQSDFRTGASTTAALYNSLGQPGYIRPVQVVSAGNVPTMNYYEVGKSQLQLNTGLTYRFGSQASKWLRRTTWRFGISNLLDADPAPANMASFGFDPSSGESLWIGRTFTLTTTKDF